MAARSKPTTGIVSSPIYSANERIFLHNQIRVLEKICDRIFVITGNFPNRYGPRVHIIEIEKGRGDSGEASLFGRMIRQIFVRVKLALHLREIHSSLSLILFDVGEYGNVIPLICAKLPGKRTLVIHLGGNKFLENRLEWRSGWQRIVPPVLNILLRVFYRLVDKILCISPSIIKAGGLEGYKHKIAIYTGEYVDTERFAPLSDPSDRESIVGYAGCLSREKGVLNLVRAIPLVVVVQCPNVRLSRSFISGT
jgi:glycosyltransferase involved in cell wall biosynthesis